MTLPQPFHTHAGRCLATWDTTQGQYVVHCVCTQEELQALAATQRQARIQSRIEAKKREDAPLYRKPFSLLR
jgi:hypothetical protein